MDLSKLTAEQWTIIIAVVGTFFVAAGLIFTAYQLRKEYAWRRKEKAIAFSNYNAEHLRGVYSHIVDALPDYNLTEEPIKFEIIDKAIKEDKKGNKDSKESLSEDIHYLLSRYEELGLSVKQHVADFDTAYDLLGTPAVQAVMAFSEYISDLREKEKRPFTWEHAVDFAVRVRETRRIEIEKGERKAKALKALGDLKKASAKPPEVAVSVDKKIASTGQ
ncbi:MAG: hypothetical protein H0X30_01750 [Anaerolineae bacterium]|nr:hypothetical protein [Anaerolineae bacterium]